MFCCFNSSRFILWLLFYEWLCRNSYFLISNSVWFLACTILYLTWLFLCCLIVSDCWSSSEILNSLIDSWVRCWAGFEVWYGIGSNSGLGFLYDDRFYKLCPYTLFYTLFRNETSLFSNVHFGSGTLYTPIWLELNLSFGISSFIYDKLWFFVCFNGRALLRRCDRSPLIEEKIFIWDGVEYSSMYLIRPTGGSNLTFDFDNDISLFELNCEIMGFSSYPKSTEWFYCLYFLSPKYDILRFLPYFWFFFRRSRSFFRFRWFFAGTIVSGLSLFLSPLLLGTTLF